MTKKLICLLISIVLLLPVFAGCGSNSGVADKAASSVPETREVTLKYVSWFTKGEDKPFLQDFMKANPGIKVEDEALEGANYDKLIKTRILSGDAPDVFAIQYNEYNGFIKEGHLMDLTNEPAMTLLATAPSLETAYTIDGKKYGFPMQVGGGPIPIYYNKKYFAKLGIAPPKTMQELYAICDKIKADKVEPFVFGDKDKWPFEYFFRSRAYSGMLDNYPEWGLSLYKGELKASEFFKNEYKLAEDLVKKGYVGKSSLTLTWPQSVPYFIEGKAAMLPQGPWVPGLPEIKAADPAKFELGAFMSPVEAVNGKKIAMGEPGVTMVVSSNTKNPEEAKKLFNYWGSADVLKRYCETWGYTTLMKVDVKTDPVLAGYYKELSSDFNLIFSQKAQMAPGFITDSYWNGLQNVLAGSPADTELKRLDTEFEKSKAAIIVTN